MKTLVTLAFVIGLLWFFIPAINLTDNNITDYFSICSTNGTDCSFDSVQYFVDPETQTVTKNGDGFVMKLDDCSVYDKKNWVCTGSDSAKDGRFSTDDGLLNASGMYVRHYTYLGWQLAK